MHVNIIHFTKLKNRSYIKIEKIYGKVTEQALKYMYNEKLTTPIACSIPLFVILTFNHVCIDVFVIEIISCYKK